jgi:hypothetical protein
MDALDEGPLNGAQTSGGVAWSRFLPFCFLVLLVAVLVAGVLDLLFSHGWYVILIVPMVAALVLAASLHLAVTYGHCRSRVVAGLLGFVAAAVMYLGQYQIDLARQAGPQFLWRVDVLPRFIAFRKKVERQEKLGAQAIPNAAGNPAQKKPDLFGNWLMLGLELTFVLFVGTYTGYCAAGRPYCNRCRKWRRRDVLFFPSDLGPQIVGAIQDDRLDTFLNLRPMPPPQQGSYTAVVLGWCPPSGTEPTCPAYLSVKAVRRGGGPTQYSQIDAVFGRMLLADHPLSMGQIVKLLPRFPVLANLARSAKQQAPRIAEEALPGSGAVVEVRPIASVDMGKILSRQTILLGNLLSFIPLLMFPTGLVLALAGFLWLKGAGETTRMAVGGSGAFMLLVAVLMLRDVGWLSRRMLLRRARTAIGMRGDALVRPEDPDAIFVQLVPRDRWGKLMLETASDVGLVKLDARRGQVLFEGDRARYRIPGEAILSCDVEKVVYGTAREPYETCVFLSVLRARGPEGVFEAPLGQRAGLSHRTAPARRQWAEQFSRQILALAPNAAAEVY